MDEGTVLDLPTATPSLEILHEQPAPIKKIETHLQEKYGSSPDLKVQSTLEFFLRPRDKNNTTPLESIESIYNNLEEVARGLRLRSMVKDADLAFVQHRENPEQYVSHGFDHTLNVLDYTRSILEHNPDVVTTVSEKYTLSSEEARFVIEMVTLYHDFGYPVSEARGLTKVNHAITGAEIISRRSLSGLVKNVTPQLLTDMRDAVLFHGSDKIEGQFDSKIKLTTGEFLVNSENIETVLGHFIKEQNTIENISLCVPDEQTKASLLEKLQRSGVTIEQIQFVTAPFAGRFADLATKKDKLLGLEFKQVDLTREPLSGIIRLADNMDITPSRLSPAQQTPAFQEICRRLGDTTHPDAVIYKTLLATDAAAVPEDIMDILHVSLQEWPGSFDDSSLIAHLDDFRAFMASPTNPDSSIPLAMQWKNYIVETTLQKHPELDPVKRDLVAEVGRLQDEKSFWHCSGSEAIKNVMLEGSVVRLQVDQDKFTQLSHSFVQETIGRNPVVIPVSEYQIWRMASAFQGIHIGDQAITIVVQTIDPSGIVTNQRIFNK